MDDIIIIRASFLLLATIGTILSLHQRALGTLGTYLFLVACYDGIVPLSLARNMTITAPLISLIYHPSPLHRWIWKNDFRLYTKRTQKGTTSDERDRTHIQFTGVPYRST